MSKVKESFYVVWKGRETGIFTNWEDCKMQVCGFEGAVYRCFPTLPLAKRAFKSDPVIYTAACGVDFVVKHDTKTAEQKNDEAQNQ